MVGENPKCRFGVVDELMPILHLRLGLSLFEPVVHTMVVVEVVVLAELYVLPVWRVIFF